MVLFGSLPCIAVFILIIALHVLSRIFSGKLSLVFLFLNIALHVLIAPLLLLVGAPFSEITLVYMVSLFVFLLSIYVKGGDKKDDV